MKKLIFLVFVIVASYINLPALFGCEHFVTPVLHNEKYQKCDCIEYWNKDTVKEKYGITLRQDDFVAYFVDTPPVIDGKGDDPAWEKANWQPICYQWMYNSQNMTKVSGPEDFSGRFKVVWTADRLYILVEIIDDVISTTRLNRPYFECHNDDCLEIFIDENALGGNRTNKVPRGGTNFFAYHLSFGGTNAADYIGGSDNITNDITTRIENGMILRNSHFNYVIDKNEAANKYTWEIEMKVYDNTYPLRSSPDKTPVTLTEGKKMGFAIAYCDSDGIPKNNPVRNHFIGSMAVTGNSDDQRNRAYQNSSQYAHLYLVK